MRRLAIVCLLLGACASTRPSDSALLKSIAGEYWQHQLDENPALHIKFGIPTRHLPDVSFAHAQHEAQLAAGWLGRLEAIHPGNLSADERISLAILRWNNRLTVDGLPYFYDRFTVAPYTFQFLSITQISRRSV